MAITGYILVFPPPETLIRRYLVRGRKRLLEEDELEGLDHHNNPYLAASKHKDNVFKIAKEMDLQYPSRFASLLLEQMGCEALVAKYSRMDADAIAEAEKWAPERFSKIGDPRRYLPTYGGCYTVLDVEWLYDFERRYLAGQEVDKLATFPHEIM